MNLLRDVSIPPRFLTCEDCELGLTSEQYLFYKIASPKKRDLLIALKDDLKENRHSQGIGLILKEDQSWNMVKQAGTYFGRNYSPELDLHVLAADIAQGADKRRPEEFGDGWSRGLLRDLIPCFCSDPPRLAEPQSTRRITFAVVLKEKGYLLDYELEKVPGGNGALYPAQEQAFIPMDETFKTGMEETAKSLLGKNLDYDIRFRIRPFAMDSLLDWTDHKAYLDGKSATGALAYGLTSVLENRPDMDGEGLVYITEWDWQRKELIKVDGEKISLKLKAVESKPQLEVVLTEDQPANNEIVRKLNEKGRIHRIKANPPEQVDPTQRSKRQVV